jgi:hypothetical protein
LTPDLILIPGGGVLPDGSLPPWVAGRFDRALELGQGQPMLCLSGGTAHKPNPLDAAGFQITEAAAGARYLMSRGAPAADILLESSSYDTIGNAYFSRVLHTEPAGWRRLLVVTSAFHAARAEAIFRWVFAAAPSDGYRLAFESVPDTGMPEPDLEFRRTRERERLHSLTAVRAGIRTMAELHEFIFTRHDAYSCEGLSKARERSPELDRVY